MIISVEDAKTLLGDVKDWTDERLSRKLKAIEDVIRSYTNNNFQNRGYRKTADIVGGLFINEALTPFVVGDTVQIHDSARNDGIYTVISADDTTFSVLETVTDENDVLVTRIDYPEAVKDCALNLLEWEVKHRDKVGIQSETLSRHSVTYFSQDANNQVMGYPASLLGCLKAYKKARF
jgi:hypothetical protein